MKFNKENFKEDLENFYNIICVIIIIIWLFSGFGFGIAGELFKNGYNILGYSVFGVDILLLLSLGYNRYFKK